MKKINIFLIILFFAITVSPQKEIVENIQVDWWVLPVFAVDSRDNSVLDLKTEDVEVYLNKKEIKDFIIYKRDFNVEQKAASDTAVSREPLKRKIVFLIFDIAMTQLNNIKRARDIALDLVAKGSDSTSFVIMLVDPYAGLQYKAGPETDKEILESVIEKEVVINERGRSVEPVMTILQGMKVEGKEGASDGTRGPKYTEDEQRFFSQEVTSGLRKANENFFYAFQSLYYSLNQISDNKFLYIFSQGLTGWSRRSTRHSEEWYLKGLKKSADLMGKSGSVVFIINPAGYEPGEMVQTTEQSLTALQTDFDSLKTIALESGGKYLRGNTGDLTKRLEKMNRAYYEIAFSDSGIPEGGTGEIVIRARRKGVKIHSLRTLEKRKRYSQMKKIEKEVLALNLLDRNRLFKPPLEIRGFDILKQEVRGKETQVRLRLPGPEKRKTVDLFVIKTGDDRGTPDAVKMEKKAVPGNIVNVVLGSTGKDRGKFVIVDEVNNIAYVEGIINFGERLKKELSRKKMKFSRKVRDASGESRTELRKILLGSADYCRELENAAFHFICKEDIEEKLQFIRKARAGFSKKESFNPNTGIMVRTRDPGAPPRKSRVQKFKQRFIYDYQLIYDQGKVTEQRKVIKGKRKEKAGKPASLRVESFLSKKIVLIPASILGLVNQGRYEFRFVKKDTVDGVKTNVIEVFPKDLDHADSIYGKIWIDEKDHSILKIEVNPLSIGGLKSLMKLASDLGSILDVKCTIDYGLKRNGIRFPTRVRIREIYHGGDFLKRVMRMLSWEKSRTTYTYKDYQFFEVGTEVKLQK